MDELKAYIDDRKGKELVFVTTTGKRILVNQIARNYAKAGKRVDLRVHSHMLRCSSITYFLSKDYHPIEVKKISGHDSVDMVAAYDKRSKAINPTQRISLV